MVTWQFKVTLELELLALYKDTLLHYLLFMSYLGIGLFGAKTGFHVAIWVPILIAVLTIEISRLINHNIKFY